MGDGLAQSIRRGARAFRRAVGFGLRKPGEAWLLVRMAAWVVLLSLAVKLMPLPRALKLIRPRRRRVGPPGANPSEVQARLAESLDMLLRTDFWVFTPTCWKRAPVLYRYLALRGVETRVVFGMRKEDAGTLAGHAWLESEGAPVQEVSAPAYAVTYVFPPVVEN